MGCLGYGALAHWRVRFTEFSPNKIAVDYAGANTVVLNFNYDSGWTPNVINEDGLLAVKGTETIRYLPTSFLIGLFITLVSLGAGLYYYKKN